MQHEFELIVGQLRDHLATLDTTQLERAEILDKLVRTIHDHVKFRSTDGRGLEGGVNPEREALAKVMNASIAYRFSIHL